MCNSCRTGGGGFYNLGFATPQNIVEFNKLLSTLNALLEDSRVDINIAIKRTCPFIEPREVDGCVGEVCMKAVQKESAGGNDISSVCSQVN